MLSVISKIGKSLWRNLEKGMKTIELSEHFLSAALKSFLSLYSLRAHSVAFVLYLRINSHILVIELGIFCVRFMVHRQWKC